MNNSKGNIKQGETPADDSVDKDHPEGVEVKRELTEEDRILRQAMIDEEKLNRT